VSTPPGATVAGVLLCVRMNWPVALEAVSGDFSRFVRTARMPIMATNNIPGSRRRIGRIAIVC
jgi:hypothetical protein